MTPLATASLTELRALLDEHGAPAFRAQQILDWRNKGITNPEEMGNIPHALREKLAEWCICEPLTPVTRQQSTDGTRKYLFQLNQGKCSGKRIAKRIAKRIETVFIPEPERGTVCISSQVGCTLDCPFCCTGSQPFDGNLAGYEIIAQVLMVMADLRRDPLPAHQSANRVSHIVFMGQGEPLSNEQGVHIALKTLLDQLDISRRRITLSTSGLIHGITRLGANYPVNLAISLHAANDALRDQLVPINRTFPLARLRQVLDDYPLPAQRHITLEYVMLAGVNDRDEDIEALARFVNKRRERVNLIRYNPHPASNFTGSSSEQINAFAASLTHRGIRTTVRRSRGDDIAAACGQLNSSSKHDT